MNDLFENMPYQARPDADSFIKNLSDGFQKNFAQQGALSAHASPRETISPYYGSSLDTELAKAKEYQSGLDHPVFSQQHEKIDDPVKIAVGAVDSSAYSPTDNMAYIADPSFEKKENAKYLNDLLSTDNNRSQKASEYLMENDYLPKDLGFAYKNPIASFFSAIEHEVGHSWTSGEHAYNEDTTHMSEPAEAANALGRIQRETFKQTGKRMDEDSLRGYMKSQVGLPEEDQFDGYSTEAKRGLRMLMRSYRGDTDDRIFNNAAKAIPSFVKASPYLDSYQSA
jgi:hypothetical protein